MIYLRFDRAQQRFAPVPGFIPAHGKAPDAERQRRRALDDSAHVATEIAAAPGITNRKLRAAARARAGAMSSDRFDVAIEISEAVVYRPASHNAKAHYLDGARVPAETLERLEDSDRELVRGAVPPPESEADR